MAADRKGHATRADYITKRSPEWRAFAKEVGANIRRRRTVLDISAPELAAALDSCLRVIRKWERGTSAPHLATLLAISVALRCDLRDLLPCTAPLPAPPARADRCSCMRAADGRGGISPNGSCPVHGKSHGGGMAGHDYD